MGFRNSDSNIERNGSRSPARYLTTRAAAAATHSTSTIVRAATRSLSAAAPAKRQSSQTLNIQALQAHCWDNPIGLRSRMPHKHGDGLKGFVRETRMRSFGDQPIFQDNCAYFRSVELLQIFEVFRAPALMVVQECQSAAFFLSVLITADRNVIVTAQWLS